MYQGVMPAAELYRQQMGSRLNATQGVSAILYDTLTYVSASTTQLRFFQTVQTNKVLGNMTIAGALPHPNAFHVYAIRVLPKILPRLATATPFPEEEMFRLTYLSFALLKIGDKEFGVFPTVALPGGGGLSGWNAGAGATAADNFLSVVTNGLPSPQAVYTLIEPIQIDPMIGFEFQLNWSAAQTLSANMDILVMFDGRMLRPVQ